MRSFRERTTIGFDKRFNILIGPNAGGKSNLFDIITMAARHYFVKVFSISEHSDQTGFFRKYSTPPGTLCEPLQAKRNLYGLLISYTSA